MIYSPSQLGSATMSTKPRKPPAYQRIYDDLKAQIDDGRLAPGDKLPTKFELQVKYRVSAQPLERALDMLEEDGLIEREQGRGIYVAGPAAERNE